MPQRYDADAIFIGAGLIVAGALGAALASVLLAVVAVRLIRRALRARRRQAGAPLTRAEERALEGIIAATEKRDRDQETAP